MIAKALKEDLPAILQLQYLAYQSEADLLHNPDIAPLKQTLREMEGEYDRGVILKAVGDKGEIIGSVRGYVEDGILYVGKLMVHPHMQGQGIGTKLLQAIEEVCPHKRCELFTSSMSQRNIKLYERAGYKQMRQKQVDRDLVLIYLEK